jgi:hypothetical protein
MFFIRPPLAANTITTKLPNVFVHDEVLDGVPDRVPDAEVKTTSCSQSIQNFRKQPTCDLIGNITHKTHVPEFSDYTSCSHNLRFKLVVCNSAEWSTESRNMMRFFPLTPKNVN